MVECLHFPRGSVRGKNSKACVTLQEESPLLIKTYLGEYDIIRNKHTRP